MTKKAKSWISVAVVLLLALIVVNSSLYTVGEADQVVIVRFGEVIGKTVTEPGLHVKTPFIDEARRFEKRWLEWDGDPSQITTLDKRYISIDIFARWRIDDPLIFIEKLRDERSALGRLDDIIDNAMRNVVANHNLIEAIRSTNREFVELDEEARASGETTEDGEEEEQSPSSEAEENDERDEKAQEKEPAQEEDEPAEEGEDDSAEPAGDPDAGVEGVDDAGLSALAKAGLEGEPPKDLPPPSELLKQHESDEEGDLAVGKATVQRIEEGRGELTNMILEKASPKAAKLGIDLKDVEIKRIDYIESVRAKVFDRMISERKRVAEAFRSQGQGLSAEILGRMEKELKTIRSEAYRRAQEIRGRADAEAARIYADAYNVDPEFYEFVKTLQSYEKTFDEETWLLMTTESDYARRIRRMSGGGR